MGAHFTAPGVKLRLSTPSIGRGLHLVKLSRTITRATSGAIYGQRGLTTSFAPASRGIEQTFDIAVRPPGSGPLTIKVPVHGLRAVTSGAAVNLIGKQRMARATYSALKVTDDRGHIVPAKMRASENGHNILITVRDAKVAYPIKVDPVWTLVTEGVAVGSSTSVAVSGSTAVVGVVGANGTANGAALVFTVSNGTWTLTATLASGVANDGYGTLVAISGSTIVVSAPAASAPPGYSYAGALYVYALGGSTWSQTAELGAPFPTSGTVFGNSGLVTNGTVIAAGDLNAGTPGVSNEGHVAVYGLSGGAWSLTANLEDPNVALSCDQSGSYDDYGFGESLAISSTALAVGNPYDCAAAWPAGEYNQGVVYMYTLSSGHPAYAQQLSAPDWFGAGGGSSAFGTAVSLDGLNLAVSAPSSDVGGYWNGDVYVGGYTWAGDVYVYGYSGSTWGLSQEFDATAPYAGQFLGNSLSISRSTIVASSGGGGNLDEAIVFTSTNGQWSQSEVLNPADGSTGDGFGHSVASSGTTASIGTDPYPASSNANFYGYSDALTVQPIGSPLTPSELFGGGHNLDPANCPCAGSLSATKHKADPVDTSTGDFSQSATDLLLPGPGPSLDFTRTYDAQAAQTEITNSSPVPALGYGWTDNLAANVSLNITTEVATITEGDGAETMFSPYVVGTSPAWCTGVTNYCASAPRVAATLNQNSGGSWTLVDYNGPPKTYSFAATGALTSIADVVGNAISSSVYAPYGSQTLCPTSNTCVAWTSSASGRVLVIGTNGWGQVTTVFDANSTEAATFTYTGSSCSTFSSVPSLCSATDPGVIKSTYTYDSGNATAAFDYDMLSFTPPKASTQTVIQYNSQGQVSQQTDPSGEITTFTYSGLNSSLAGGTTITTAYPNGLSGTQDVTADTYSSNVIVSETTGYGTSAAATTDYLRDPVSLLPLQVTDPNGNTTTYTYQTFSGTGGTQISSSNILTSTDGAGNTTAYAYTAFNQPWCTIDPADYANGVRCPSRAPSFPPLPGASDPNLGMVIAYYNSSDQPVATTDALGNTTTFTYTQAGSSVPVGLLYCSIDPANYQASVNCPVYGSAHVIGTAASTFDASGDLTVSTDAVGGTTSYAYGLTASQPGLPSSITDAAGDLTTLTYNGASEVTSKVETFGLYSATSVSAYDAFGRPYCTVSAYEQAKGVTCPSSPPSPPSPTSDPYLGATIINYDAAGRVTQTTNPLGGVTLTAYDGAGELYCTVLPVIAKGGITCPSTSSALTTPTPGSDAYIGATITTYNADNQAIQVTNPGGGIVLDSLDANGNVITSTIESNDATHAPNITTAYAYTGDNQVSQVTTATGTALTYYDPNGHVFCSVSPDAFALGSPAYQCPAWVDSWITAPPMPSTFYSTTPTVTQANNVTTSFANVNGDLVQTTDPDVHTTTAAYDSDGRAYCALDPVNVIVGAACPTTPPTTPPATGSNPGYTTTIYNSLGEVKSSTNQLGDTTAYTYDALGNVLTVNNPLGKVTTNCYYDQLCSGESTSGGPGGALYSALTSATSADPSGELTTHTYYPGDLPDVTVTQAATTTLAYDALGDSTSVTYAGVQSGYTTPTNLTYTYNVDGSPNTMTDATGTTTYFYDVSGDVVSQNLVAIGSLVNQTIGYTYFTNGELATEIYPSYAGHTNPTVTYAYNSTGQMASSADWLGNTVNYTFDHDGNLKSQANPNSTTTNAFDAADNQLSASSVVNQTCGGAENLLQSFGSSGTPSGSRNADGQLNQYGVSYSATCSGQTSLERNYSYDRAGQVVYQGSTVQGASPNTYAYDAASQPTTISNTQSGGLNTYTQSFDNSGEVTGQIHTSGTGGVSASYAYDSLGDQTAISSPSTTYAYNAAGQMVSATTTSGTTTYLYNGVGLVASGKAPSRPPSWNAATDVNAARALKAVSCAPGTTFCAAVGASGYATAYNGTVWSTPIDADVARTLVSVSCPTATFCVAVDSSGYEVTYNGTAWSAPVDIDGSKALTAVSCPTSSFCVAVGSGGYAATYSSGVWAAAAKVDSTRSMTALSCASSTFCVAADGSGYEATLSGTSWSASKIDGTKAITVITCISSSWCVAADGSGDVINFNGSSWSLTIVGTPLAVNSVSCVSSTFCEAATSVGWIFTWNGLDWGANQPVDGTNNITGVKCLSNSFCVGTDASGNALTYNAPGWSASNVDATRSFTALSCASTALCGGVDSSGYAAVYQTPVAGSAQLTWDSTARLPLLLSDSAYDYVYGPGATPVEQINLSTSTPTFLAYTPESSTYVATNTAGDLMGFWGYDAYGNLSYGTPVSAFGYAGQYTDASTGLSNMRARFYQSQTGNFTTRDPAFASTDTAFTYAGGDPVNNWDLMGLCNSGVANGYYPGRCATTAAESMAAANYIQNHVSGGGWSLTQAVHSEVNYLAGVGNGIVSTVTFGQVHVPAPYCNALSWAYGVGSGFGYATAIVGTATAGGALLRAADLSGSPLIGRGSVLFARGSGLLNSNNIIRLGWGWSAPAGSEVFRLAIGSAGAFIHWHLDLF